jgi:hypothetical protein
MGSFMKKFERKEIDHWRSEFKQRGYYNGVARVADREIDYFVMPEDLFEGPAGKIPFGLYRMTGNRDDGHLIAVSSEVPTMIRASFAISEHDEFMVYGVDDGDRTLHSEKNMVGLLGDDSFVRANYILHKIVLYDHIVENSRDNLPAWDFTPEDHSGFQRALDFLESQ